VHPGANYTLHSNNCCRMAHGDGAEDNFSEPNKRLSGNQTSVLGNLRSRAEAPGINGGTSSDLGLFIWIKITASA
jgi:hypothetical protein